MLDRKKTDKLYTVIWCAVLCVYWVAILCINFAQNPKFYCTDMYTDMNYALQAWTQKSVIPDGWVFGNQRYVVATPVLAALFMGLTGDPCVAMGMASTLVGAALLLSFGWMLRPVLPKLHHRLAAMAAFMTLVLMAGDAVFFGNGWQLFFTMCSYYACYAINLFLAFGCYLRKNRLWSAKTWVMLGLTCLMSVGTGFQSLRQTVIMVCPLVAAECIRGIECLAKKRKFGDRSLVIAGSIALSNLLGLVLGELIATEQTTIFGTIRRAPFRQMLSGLTGGISNALALFGKLDAVAAVAVVLICGYVILRAVRDRSIGKDPAALCGFLLIVSVGVLLAVDTVTTMPVRDIYYFPLYALAAILPAWVYARFGKAVRIGVTAALCLCVLLNCTQKLPHYLRLPKDTHPVDAVSAYLEDEGITTVYSAWNCGEQIAIASDFSIAAGFWDRADQPFERVDYLCDPSVFDADPATCAYIFCGEQAAKLGVEAARERNTELVLMKYFPETDFYVYSADVNLMK